MQADGRNHTDIGTLPGIGNTIRLLAVQLLVVGILVASLFAIQAGTASADTGAVPPVAQVDPGDGAVTGQCFIMFCLPW